jgi:hypothetical protein
MRNPHRPIPNHNGIQFPVIRPWHQFFSLKVSWQPLQVGPTAAIPVRTLAILPDAADRLSTLAAFWKFAARFLYSAGYDQIVGSAAIFTPGSLPEPLGKLCATRSDADSKASALARMTDIDGADFLSSSFSALLARPICLKLAWRVSIWLETVAASSAGPKATLAIIRANLRFFHVTLHRI